MDADASRTLAHLPIDEAGRPGRAPVNSQPDVTEAAVSVVVELATSVTVYEDGQRNACNV